MAKNYRPGRIGEEIKKIVSELLRDGLRDPRLSSMITINAVEVTGDYSYATVFFTVLNGTDDEKKAIIDAFINASGYIRKEIGHKMSLRHVPLLRFKYDTSLEYGMHMDKIIEDLKNEE